MLKEQSCVGAKEIFWLVKTKLFTIWSFAKECYQWPLSQHLFLWAFLISVNSNSISPKAQAKNSGFFLDSFSSFTLYIKSPSKFWPLLSSKYTHDPVTFHDHYCCIPGPSHYHFLPKLFNGFIIGLPILCAVSLLSLSLHTTHSQFIFNIEARVKKKKNRSQGYHFKILSQMTLCHFQSLPFTSYLTHINEHLF